MSQQFTFSQNDTDSFPHSVLSFVPFSSPSSRGCLFLFPLWAAELYSSAFLHFDFIASAGDYISQKSPLQSPPPPPVLSSRGQVPATGLHYYLYPTKTFTGNQAMGNHRQVLQYAFLFSFFFKKTYPGHSNKLDFVTTTILMSIETNIDWVCASV